jgi:hypothetical protein
MTQGIKKFCKFSAKKEAAAVPRCLGLDEQLLARSCAVAVERAHFDDGPEAFETPGGFRLVRVIITETLLVALAGLLVWGIAWDINFPKTGMVLAIIVWLTVSPVIEIATLAQYRRERKGHAEFRNPNQPSTE